MTAPTPPPAPRLAAAIHARARLSLCSTPTIFLRPRILGVVAAVKRQRLSLKNPPRLAEELLSKLEIQRLRRTVARLRALAEPDLKPFPTGADLASGRRRILPGLGKMTIWRRRCPLPVTIVTKPEDRSLFHRVAIELSSWRPGTSRPSVRGRGLCGSSSSGSRCSGPTGSTSPA